jgi:hypothetical protein
MATYEVEIVRDFIQACTDCEKYIGKLQISSVLANPPHADTVEWIEIKNISAETINLDVCTIGDETKKFQLR